MQMNRTYEGSLRFMREYVDAPIERAIVAFHTLPPAPSVPEELKLDVRAIVAYCSDLGITTRRTQLDCIESVYFICRRARDKLDEYGGVATAMVHGDQAEALEEWIEKYGEWLESSTLHEGHRMFELIRKLSDELDTEDEVFAISSLLRIHAYACDLVRAGGTFERFQNAMRVEHAQGRHTSVSHRTILQDLA